MRSIAAALLLLPVSCKPVDGRPPVDWSIAELDRTGKTVRGEDRNVRWRAKLGPFSFTTPVVADGLVWVGTGYFGHSGGPHKEDVAALMCFRESDGALLWQQVTPRHWGQPGVTSIRGAPRVEGDRLWYLTNRWEVVCLDIDPLRRGSGEALELWRTDLPCETGALSLDRSMGWFPGSSVAGPWEGRLYVSTGANPGHGDPEEVRPGSPALVCLDAATGRVLARETAGIASRLVAPCWSTPVIARCTDGRTLVLFGGGDGFLYAFDPVPEPGTGALKEVWRRDGNPPELRRKRGEAGGILGTPVVHEGRVYSAISREADDHASSGNLSCLDLATGKTIWEFRKTGFSISSAAIDDGVVLHADNDGFIRALDDRTGEQIWQYDPLATILASPLLVDGIAYLGNSDGDLTILDVRSLTRRARTLKRPVEVSVVKGRTVLTGADQSRLLVPEGAPPPIRIRPFHESVAAAPSLAHGALIVGTGGWLYSIRESGAEVPSSPEPAGPRPPAPDALFVPTPHDVVRKMMEAAAVKRTDVLYDLGSGDGRIVIEAAKSHACAAVGFELDSALVSLSREAIRMAGLVGRARIEREDLLQADLGGADVIVLYVGTRLNGLLLPKLVRLKPGVRIVTHEYPLPGIREGVVVRMRSSEDGREHVLHVYTTPLKDK